MNIEKEKIGHPYKVPDGYFEKLENEILLKTIDNQFVTNIEKQKKWNIWPLGIAASFVIICGLFWANYNKPDTNTEKELAQVSQSQAIAYLETRDIGLDEIQSEISNENIEFENIELEFLPENIEPEINETIEKGLLN